MFDRYEKLSREFYVREPILVAKELLGKYLIHHSKEQVQVGRIVEVEAYLGPHDLAAHSSKGVTSRTKIMFGPPGYAYVYLIYGIYHCLNVVVGEGTGAAILLRALEPIQNITERTQGPGLLCNALEITRAFNGHDLLSTDFYIAQPTQEPVITIVERPRIGIAYAKEWADKLLRFYIKENAFVSKK